MWTSRQLHEELAAIYRQYRGVMAPISTMTENIWRKIEETEAAESKRRGR